LKVDVSRTYLVVDVSKRRVEERLVLSAHRNGPSDEISYVELSSYRVKPVLLTPEEMDGVCKAWEAIKKHAKPVKREWESNS